MRGVRKAAVRLASVLMLALMTVTVYATEDTRQKLDAAQQEKKETESKLDQTEENIAALNEQQKSLQGALTTLNTELSQVSNNLSDLEEKIAVKETEIDVMNANILQVQEDIEEAIRLKDEHYEAMKKQIKFMYERSDYLYLELFFSSGSVSDFINKKNYGTS